MTGGSYHGRRTYSSYCIEVLIDNDEFGGLTKHDQCPEM